MHTTASFSFRRFLVTLFALVMISVSAMADDAADSNNARRRQWTKEMQQAKIEFMTKQLELTDEQKEKFVTVYTAMDNELGKLRYETDRLRHSIKGKKQVTDLEYEKAAEAMFEFKAKEADIELKYLPKFKEMLTPKQLFKFKGAEMKWMRQLMKHRKKK